ncbi:unnamed protein product [Triticum turgidum subsp. durum]|uniref:BHLH domain-containing protein n=1 Tax=Triticum turgidum subsp. durum TaxID=4567 RepID=A0A9R0ZFU6_TRITD|nr:unnamed protein product [Triticum turgidum subsp. durum]
MLMLFAWKWTNLDCFCIRMTSNSGWGVGVKSRVLYNAEVGSHVNKLDLPKDSGSNKRLRSEPCGRPTSKACREKVRRDKLNDRFLELGTTLDPGKPVKADKAAILSDATRMVTQLRAEAQQLKDTNGSLEDKIKELKVRQPYLGSVCGC